jgi:hypothetical protein
MKTKINLFLFYFTIIISTINSVHGQQSINASGSIKSFHFKNIFALKGQNPDTIYCLLGQNYFGNLHSNNTNAIIRRWLRKHKNSNIIFISAYGPLVLAKSNSRIIYCIIVESGDTLNNFLVKNGCFNAENMRWPEKVDIIDRNYIPNKSPLVISSFLDKKALDIYFDQIISNEIFAKEHKLGIWENENMGNKEIDND